MQNGLPFWCQLTHFPGKEAGKWMFLLLLWLVKQLIDPLIHSFIHSFIPLIPFLSFHSFHSIHSLYPPCERSELTRYIVMLFSFCLSFCVHPVSIAQTNSTRDLNPGPLRCRSIERDTHYTTVAMQFNGVYKSLNTRPTTSFYSIHPFIDSLIGVQTGSVGTWSRRWHQISLTSLSMRNFLTFCDVEVSPTSTASSNASSQLDKDISPHCWEMVEVG